MHRTVTSIAVFLLLFGLACSSFNRADKAIEDDVRAKIAEAMPGKTFSVEVNVNKGVVTLSGQAASEDDRRRIGDAANSVRGVRSVINNITLQP